MWTALLTQEFPAVIVARKALCPSRLRLWVKHSRSPMAAYIGERHHIEKPGARPKVWTPADGLQLLGLTT